MKNANKIQGFSFNFFIIAFVLCLLTASEGAQAARFSNLLDRVSAKQKSKQSNKSEHIFEKIRKNFNMSAKNSGMRGHAEVQKYVKSYNQSKKSLIQHTVQAGSHLTHVIEQVKRRNLPGELALLPMIESNFKQNAISNRGAAGIWQIMPGTGKRFGLKRTGKYDGRKDVQASTSAALTYLEYLHKHFKGDWMLALAAYNAGEGTVDRAIKRNQKAGKPTSFWDLKLPKQTRVYVPKFLALTQVINQH